MRRSGDYVDSGEGWARPAGRGKAFVWLIRHSYTEPQIHRAEHVTAARPAPTAAAWLPRGRTLRLDQRGGIWHHCPIALAPYPWRIRQDSCAESAAPRHCMDGRNLGPPRKVVGMRATLTLPLALAVCAFSVAPARAQLTWSLAGGSEQWPAWAREAVTRSMDEAVATFNQHGFFEKHVTANYNPGVPTAQGNYDGWIDFGGSNNTRVAIHEISHTLGTAYFWATGSGPVSADTAAGRLVKLYDGQGAVLNTGGTHFWPYNLNFDNEDGRAPRERLCKLVAAFRFDAGIVKDSDRDGLPDDWERHHFANLDQDGTGDPDADGIANRDEYASDADPNLACPVRDGATYLIRSQLSGRVLSAVDANLAEGTRLSLRTADGAPLQHWTAHYVERGFFRFTPAGSERVLQTPGPDTASGRALELASVTNALQQQWRVVSGPGAEPDYFQIASRETARVVDGLDAAEGAPVQQYPFLGNIPQQFWRFEQVGGPITVGGDAGTDGGSAGSGDGGVVAIGDAGNVGAGFDAASPADAAATSADAASERDAQLFGEGRTLEEPERDGGCALSHGHGEDTSGPPWTLAGLVGLLLVRVRRRRGRSAH